ncbi:diguanylate cyclase [Scytonema hofmannii PCC 7110]|uniref:histidine kinase n=1 Tax=Scytonema hofmannii PCC 7110 TaxID=128403 RepID=A0A139WW16_9CYAN|nr:GAF domain-containing protein [Scytonema hofmannii]KYC36625.1 diguanylate cyclase [Scytonema hofmannii PCC 7110]
MTETSPKPVATTAPLPANEVERLEALRRYNILDTPPEAAFDRITSLAARLFNVPIALVSLVDASRGWFKSSYGFDVREVQRDTTICSFALLSNEVLVIPDTRQDNRLVCNPFVQNEPGLRFYAGAPLLTQDGFNLGTLCLLDTKPRDTLTNEQTAILADLAAMVMDELELRLAARKIAQIDAALLEVTQGVSAVTGEAFFSALVQHLSKVLGVDYTYIGLVEGDNQEAIRTLAVYSKGQIVDNFAYLLHETPCKEVLQQRKLCCYPNRVQALFPNAPLLEPLNVESYVAIPFFDLMGVPLGLLGVMDGKPLTNVQLAESLLTIFALRIATELERQQTEAARQQAQYELERLVEQRTAELSQANELLHLEIAERQQAEAALQKEQELLRVLLDNVQAGIVACNAEGILTLFNRAAREFHGLPEQPLPPDRWAEYYDLYLPDGKTQMSKNEIPLFRALQGQTVENVEMAIAPKQRTTKTLLASGQAIVDSQGKKQGAVVVMHDITERKQAEAELLISDVALQQMPDAILLTDLEGKIQRWLGNAEQIFGYTAAEAIGKPVNFLHRSDIKAAMTAEIIQSIQTTGEFCGEIPCLRKDGSAVSIETTAKTVYDKAGNPIFFIGINKDITERKQAEAERAQLMRQQVQEQTARIKAEVDQQRSAFLAAVSTVLASSLDYEWTLASVANLVVPFFADWCAIDLLQNNQLIHRVAVAHRDPTKVEFVGEIHRQYPRQSDATEGVPKVLQTGKTEMVTEIPDAALLMVAQNAEHLRILHELGLKSSIISPLIARGQILGAISFVTAESERRYSEADLALAEDIAHRTAIAIDNARLYEAERTARNVAESANRVKDEFLAVLSHELRTPLNPILGWSKLLRTGKLDTAKTDYALETIERNAKLQTQLIEDLLDVSRILQGKLSLNMVPVNLASTIQSALETVRLAAEAKSIDLRFTILNLELKETDSLLELQTGGQQPENLKSEIRLEKFATERKPPDNFSQNPKFQVLGDSARIQQVVWNLLSNAVKFTPQGGQVEIGLLVTGDSSSVEDKEQRTNDTGQMTKYAQIQVTDTGKGISPDFLPYVFEYFRQADSTTTRIFGGLGLGLAIVRHLVELHGGTVAVDSPGEGQGATFTVRLPMKSESVTPKDRTATNHSRMAAPDTLSLTSVRVLVVDDEVDSRDFLTFVLEQAGAEVTATASAREALQVLAQFKPDILLCDIGMPETDGYMLMRQIRALESEQENKTPAIALTAYAGEVNQKQALAVGFQEHIAKPVTPEILVQAIRRLARLNRNVL